MTGQYLCRQPTWAGLWEAHGHHGKVNKGEPIGCSGCSIRIKPGEWYLSYLGRGDKRPINYHLSCWWRPPEKHELWANSLESTGKYRYFLAHICPACQYDFIYGFKEFEPLRAEK